MFSKKIFENLYNPDKKLTRFLYIVRKYFTQTNRPLVELEDSKLFVQISLLDMFLSQQHLPPTLTILFHRGALYVAGTD
jgi:hypothetical protein